MASERFWQLLGGWPTPLKNDAGVKVSWDYEIPNIWTNKTCSKPPTRSTVSNQWKTVTFPEDRMFHLHGDMCGPVFEVPTLYSRSRPWNLGPFAGTLFPLKIHGNTSEKTVQILYVYIYIVVIASSYGPIVFGFTIWLFNITMENGP